MEKNLEKKPVMFSVSFGCGGVFFKVFKIHPTKNSWTPPWLLFCMSNVCYEEIRNSYLRESKMTEFDIFFALPLCLRLDLNIFNFFGPNQEIFHSPTSKLELNCQGPNLRTYPCSVSICSFGVKENSRMAFLTPFS